MRSCDATTTPFDSVELRRPSAVALFQLLVRFPDAADLIMCMFGSFHCRICHVKSSFDFSKQAHLLLGNVRRKTKEAVDRVLSTGVQSIEEMRKLLAMETV